MSDQPAPRNGHLDSTDPSPRPNQSRTTTSVLYIAFSYGNIAMVVVQGLLLVPLYLNYIGAELYGAWLATNSVLLYLSVLDLNFTAVIRQQVAEAYGSRDRRRVSEVVGTGLIIISLLAVLVVLGGFLLAPFVPQFVGASEEDAAVLSVAILVAALAQGMFIFANSLSDVAVGLQRVVAISVINLVAWAIGIASTVFGLLQGWGLLSIPLGFLIRGVAYTFGLTCNVIIIWMRQVALRPRFRRGELFKLGSLVSFVFLGRTAETLITRMDELIVARMFGPAFVTIFVLTGRSRDVIRTVPDRIGFAVVPPLAHLYGEKGIEAVRQRAMQVLSITVDITVACAAGIIALNEAFVGLWVGSDMYGGAALTMAIAIYFVLVVSRSLLARLLFATGVVKIPNQLLLIESAVRIPLVIGLAYVLGLVGLPVGAALALLAVHSVFLVKLFVQRMRFDLADFRSRSLAFLVYPALAMAIAVVWMRNVSPQNWLQFLINAVLLGLLLMVILWFMNPDFRLAVAGIVVQFQRRYLRRPDSQMTS